VVPARVWGLLRVSSDDSQAQVRQIPPVFPEDRSEEREAAKSGHLQDARCCGEARTGGSVFQTRIDELSLLPVGTPTFAVTESAVEGYDGPAAVFSRLSFARNSGSRC
jgi:hypothetical protein